MALSEEVTPDKIEVIGPYRTVQVRVATIVSKDDVELARSFHRHVIECQVKVDDEWTDPDLSSEYQEVQDVCTSGIWTEAVKEAYRESHEEPN
jgi:hypothetical protein